MASRFARVLGVGGLGLVASSYLGKQAVHVSMAQDRAADAKRPLATGRRALVTRSFAAPTRVARRRPR
jgi:D-arabinose 1-dehydrogenase-like Zn-dependent alcohol dehydrogenase